jgi:hypothetical protein
VLIGLAFMMFKNKPSKEEGLLFIPTKVLNRTVE